MDSIDTLQEQARAIGEKIGEIEDTKRRADNGKKVGRYFKTRNSYSCPEKPSDYWWVYAEVTKMDEHGFLYTTEFQTDRDGLINVRFNHYSYHMQGWTQITRAEVRAAWKRMNAKLDKMAPV